MHLATVVRGAWAWLPAVVLGALFLAGWYAVRNQTEPERAPVVVTRDFSPIHIQRLDVDPDPLVIGREAALLNGICNDSDEDISVQLYLGAQSAVGDPLFSPHVDFVGKDTPEGRLRKSLPPGCTGTEPLRAVVSPLLTPGLWQLRVHVVATGPRGEMQNLEKTSPVFRVVEGP